MTTPPDRIHGWQDSQLSIARFYGRITYKGHTYTIAVAEKGAPLVRADVLAREAKERLSSASDALENQHARITDLESQLAQRFDAADMATASAQGFRDGAASVNAGSEPVPNNRRSLEAVFRGLSDRAYCNYIEQMRRDACLGWEHKAAHGKFGEAELKGHTIAGEMLGRHKAFAEAANALRGSDAPLTYPSPPDGMAGWISVDERLPEVGVTVLVYEPFRHGEDWPGTVRILFDYICPDYEDWHDHCASHEHFMAVGGANACGPDVTCTGPSEKAPYTHWMPLPAAPGPADGESK